jgi:hypothetical protein
VTYNSHLVLILTVIASFASILSVPIAIAQTIRIRRLNIEKKLKIWTQISSIKAMMRLLEAQKIETSYGLVCEQFRDWLREAVLLEKDFSIETIKLWRRVGKLSSDWQEYQAAQLLSSPPTQQADGIARVDEGLAVPLSQFDTTPPDHLIATAPANPLRPTTIPPQHPEGMPHDGAKTD